MLHHLLRLSKITLGTIWAWEPGAPPEWAPGQLAAERGLALPLWDKRKGSRSQGAG